MTYTIISPNVMTNQWMPAFIIRCWASPARSKAVRFFRPPTFYPMKTHISTQFKHANKFTTKPG